MTTARRQVTEGYGGYMLCLCLMGFLGIGTVAAQEPDSSRTSLTWEHVAPGMWKASVGTPEDVSLLQAAGIDPRREALEAMAHAEFPLPTSEIRAAVRDGKIVLRFPLTADEQLYGLGLHFQTVQQRGAVRTLHVDHYGGQDNGRTHAPVPFYVSSRGYGVLVDVARYVRVYAGSAVSKDSKHPPQVRDRNTDPAWTSQPRSDAVELLVPATGATVYVFGGPTPMDAVRRYNLYNGGGVLPPKWGLGFLHRVPTLFTAEDALREVDAFAEKGYPLDVLGLEPGWQSRAYPGTYTWDATRFPNPEGFMQAMRARGVGVNLWVNPYVSPESPIYEAMQARSGSHTVWTGIVPDYAQPETRSILLDLFQREHIDLGVSGYKIDEVDGYDRWLWPDHATFPSGLSGEQMRQVYGLYMQRMIADLYHARNQRTFGLVRASNAGASSLPFVLYNDYYSHRDFITALVNSSFIGVLWTPEVRSSQTGEEWLRRMQSVCFSPLAMLNAWADGTKPWSFPKVADAVREVMQLRIQLLPYLYTTFAQYHFEGTPPFRAMPLVAGFLPTADDAPGRLDATENPYAEARAGEIKDQYMVGDNLIVAPLFAGEESREVVLPPGKWYDFYTGAYAGAGEVITVTPGLEQIPVFVRDGGIVPMIEPRRQVPRPDEAVDLVVRHYGTAEGTFQLYDDDGTTFDYERGAYTWTELKVARAPDGSLQGEVHRSEPGMPFTYRTIQWRFMTP